MILVTGGVGYIGSHTCVELLAAGFDLVVLDNLSNSSIASLERVAGIVNVECSILNVDSGSTLLRADFVGRVADGYAVGDRRASLAMTGSMARDGGELVGDRHASLAMTGTMARDEGRLVFVEGDIRDRELLRAVFAQFEIEAVIHFAGLKAVGESVAMPLRYYDNNVSGSVAEFGGMAHRN